MSSTSAPQTARIRWHTWALLAAVIVVGGYFRTLNLTGWDGTSDLHPDERFIIYTTYNLRVPHSFADYLRSDCVRDGVLPNAKATEEGGQPIPLDRQEPTTDSGCNTLNPRNYNWSRFFVYGTLPTTLTRIVAEALQPLWGEPGQLVGPESVRNTGRALSTLFDLGSVALVFLIGRRLYDERVGLLGALLLALSALPIQLAHFFTVDSFTGFFVLLAVYWTVRAMQGGGALSFTMLGVSIGAAMACRFTMATLGLLGIVAVAVRLWEGRRPEQALSAGEVAGGHTLATGELTAGRRTAAGSPYAVLALLVLAGAVSLLSWRVLQPDAFVGTSFFDIRPEPRFLKNVQEIAALISGEVDSPPSQQWASRTPYLFSWQNMVIWGMGLPLGLAAWAGWAAAGWQIVRHRRLVHAIPWVWVAFYFAWQGGQFVMTMRYYALLYGLLAMFAAWGLIRIADRGLQIADRRPRGSAASGLWSAARWLPLAFVAAGTLLWAIAFTRIYTEPHSRIQASRWIYENIPPGSTITFEEWDDPLPLAVDGQNPGQYIGIKTLPYWEDDPIKYFGYVDGDGQYQEGLLDTLDRADYLIFSSNRVYDSATRLRMRYPALTRYYHHLFRGELGFELVADIHSYPRLLGIELPSPILAEEAFSVYDHPRVLIFKKTPRYSRELAERLITGGVSWDEVYKITTRRASAAPTALRLTDEQWPAYRDAGTWGALFTPDVLTGAVPWLFWLLALEALGLACFALLFRLLPGLPDRGFALAKTFGLLLVAYLAWLLASIGADDGRPLMSFSSGSVWVCALLLIAAGALVGWRGRRELLAFWRRRRTTLLAAEALFLVAFFGFLVLRALNPDLWHPARGGEKPMDLAFLNAVLKSPAFPPYDPWFAGGYINYYYFGFVLVGVLIHMTGIAPSTAYNLAVPTIFALTALGAWGAAYNLVALRGASGTAARGDEAGAETSASTTRSQRWLRRERLALAAGVAAAVLAVLTGNLANAGWLLPGSAVTDDPGIPLECQAASSYAEQNECRGRAEWAFWDATRIVGIALQDGTINEFPFFTFLYGDLHAHMIAMPLMLAALMLIVALIRARSRELGQPWRQWRRAGAQIFALGALALVAGALRATNTWDYPTALGLGVLALALLAWRSAQRGATPQQALGRWLLGSAALVALSVLLFLPFTSKFATDYAGFELWAGSRTPMAEFLMINGLWLFLLVSAALALFVRTGRASRRWATAIGGGLALIAAGGALLEVSALPLQAALVAAGIAGLIDLALRRELEPADVDDGRRGAMTPLDDGPVQIQLSLEAPGAASRPPALPLVSLPVLLAGVWGLCAVGITLFTEVLVGKGDIGRMNTVFKFGMQSWLLFAVVSGVALVWLWSERSRGTIAALGARAGLIWRGAASVLIAAALVYPLTATPARLADRFDTSIGPTLDGEAFMRSEQSGWSENGQHFTFAQDAAAIAWVRQNIAGTPVLLEAHAEAYRWAGRFSVYTGLPTILGWPWHETQQRSAVDGGTIVGNRQRLIQRLYDGTDPNAALRELQLYGVEYVVVGQLERALYSPEGLAKFDEMARQGVLRTVYSQHDTRIYQVPPADQPAATLHITAPVRPPALPTDTLALRVPVDMLPAVDEYGWNRLADNQVVAVALWLLAWYGLLALGLPVAALVFRRRSAWSDGGFVWARLVGLLLLGYAVWLPVSARLWQYDRWGLLAGVLLVLAVDALALIALGRQAPRAENQEHQESQEPIGGSRSQALNSWFWRGMDEVARGLKLHRRQILQTELVFLCAFVFMAGVRALNPDLWQPIWGGEKPFEFGFLNALLRSPVLPPYSPFFSGGTINYYYYGFFLVSLPVKATGIAPAVAFNLIVPTLFALLLAGAYAIGARLAGSWKVGAAAALLVGVVGNLAGAFGKSWLGRGGLAQAWEALQAGPGGFGDRLGDWFMGASRVVPNTINEFPYFSYLFADLHPHMIALPITLLLIALAYELFLGQRAAAEGSPWPAAAGRWSLAAVTLGALATTNSWDFPTYGLLLGGALLGRAWRAPAASARARLALLAGAGLAGLGLGAAALALYAPFFQNYRAFVSGVGLVMDTTSVSDYLLLYGLFLAVLVPAVFGAAWRLLRVLERRPRRPGAPAATPRAVGFVAGLPRSPGAGGLRAVLLAAMALVVLIAMAQPALDQMAQSEPSPLMGLFSSVLGLRLWLAALLLVGAGVLLSRRIGPPAWFAVWLAVVGWTVSLLFELIYVRDHLQGGEWYRMNTVFKFGLQAWVLLALGAALALPRVWRALRRKGPIVQAAGAALLSVLLALSLAYPLIGTPSRVALRFPETTGPTLDGLAFLERATFPMPSYMTPEGTIPPQIELKHDGEAIRWLLANLRGTPVVLQSSLEFYRAYGVRVAANTGFPTIVSPLHESEQRPGDLVGERDRDVQRIYTTLDEQEALRLLSRYRVGYVYVGPIERFAYGEDGAAKWDRLTQPTSARPAYLEQVYRNEQVSIYKVDERVWMLPKLPPGEPPLSAGPRPQPQSDDVAPEAAPPDTTVDLADLERRVAENPTAAGTAFELAQRYWHAGRADEAAAVLAVAAQANPRDVGLHHLWSDILLDLRRYDEAEEALRRAVTADPSAGNWNKLGVGMLQADRLDKAEIAFLQALAINPSETEPILRLGQLYERRGERERAAEQYRRYLEVAGADADYRIEAEDGLARVTQ